MRYDHVDEFLPEHAFRAWGPPGRKTMTLEGGKGDSPQPDPMIGIAQKQMADLAVRQQDWYEQYLAPRLLDQMDQNLALSREQAARDAAMQDYQRGLMEKYDQRYWNTQVPLEDQLIQQAMTYNEAAEREALARTASADVAQAFDVAQQDNLRALALRGVNLGSGAAAALAADMATQRALAQAGAMTKTREAARQLGWTKLGEAAALGRGLPGFGATSAGLSLNAGQAALGAGQMGMGSIAQVGGIANQTASTVGNLWNGAGQLGVQKYNADIQAAKTGGSGIGSLVGGIAGSFFAPIGSAVGSKLGNMITQ